MTHGVAKSSTGRHLERLGESADGQWQIGLVVTSYMVYRYVLHNIQLQLFFRCLIIYSRTLRDASKSEMEISQGSYSAEGKI